MSFEVEVKYRSVDHDELRQRLLARRAVGGPQVAQEDIYWNHPARDFAATHEALRLRRIGAENRITYKGPRRQGPTKTREEIEVPFASGADAFGQLARLFANLGFEPVATIRKTRTNFHVVVPPHRMEVALDHAEDLGDFAEIEVQAAVESDLPAAQAAVLALAAELGLTEVEPRSYLRMFLEAHRERPSTSPALDDPTTAGTSVPRSDRPETG
jgi:adenylate cyclase class 2